MLGDLFGNDDDNDTPEATQQAQKSTYYRTKSANCAGDLPNPPEVRQASNFVGLKNQGATCYLNSLFQLLYMTP